MPPEIAAAPRGQLLRLAAIWEAEWSTDPTNAALVAQGFGGRASGMFAAVLASPGSFVLVAAPRAERPLRLAATSFGSVLTIRAGDAPDYFSWSYTCCM